LNTSRLVLSTVDGAAYPIVDTAGYAPFGFGYRRCAGERFTVEVIKDFLRTVWRILSSYPSDQAPSSPTPSASKGLANCVSFDLSSSIYRKDEETMARVVVNAAVLPTAQDVHLIVSVSGAADGLPRSGLAPANFDVASIAGRGDTALRQHLVAQTVEGPVGAYQLILEQSAELSAEVSRDVIFVITVIGDAAAGWADDQGQAIAVGRSA
jgi:hypothetical protein